MHDLCALGLSILACNVYEGQVIVMIFLKNELDDFSLVIAPCFLGVGGDNKIIENNMENQKIACQQISCAGFLFHTVIYNLMSSSK